MPSNKTMFRQVNTTIEQNKLMTLLLDIMRKRLDMSTLLLTTSDSCGVPYLRHKSKYIWLCLSNVVSFMLFGSEVVDIFSFSKLQNCYTSVCTLRAKVYHKVCVKQCMKQLACLSNAGCIIFLFQCFWGRSELSRH